MVMVLANMVSTSRDVFNVGMPPVSTSASRYTFGLNCIGQDDSDSVSISASTSRDAFVYQMTSLLCSCSAPWGHFVSKEKLDYVGMRVVHHFCEVLALLVMLGRNFGDALTTRFIIQVHIKLMHYSNGEDVVCNFFKLISDKIVDERDVLITRPKTHTSNDHRRLHSWMRPMALDASNDICIDSGHPMALDASKDRCVHSWMCPMALDTFNDRCIHS
ncbi:hypothetical protein CR513_49992, partial [Mucuna pruriens]